MNDARKNILAAASSLFLKGGVPSLSVRAIAREAGISTIGIYSHFNGKQGILDALYIEGFNLVYDAMAKQTDMLGDESARPVEQKSLEQKRQAVIDACAAYMDVGRNHEAHYRLIFGERDASYQPSLDAELAAKRAFAKLVSVAGVYLGESTNQRNHQLALDVWAIVHGFVSISHHVSMANQNINWKQQAIDAVERQLAAY